MPEKSKPTLDDILKELRIMSREKKRDRVLAKIDSSFFVLITLATFFSGITITWHKTLMEFKVLPFFIGFVITLIFAFIIGFKGMVNDSVDTRIFSWTMLFASFLWGITGLISNSLASISGDLLIYGFSAKYIIAISIGFFVGLFLPIFQKKFVSLVEEKLSSLLNEKIKVSVGVHQRIFWLICGIWVISLLLAILHSEILL